MVDPAPAPRFDFRGLRRPDGRLLLVLLLTVDALIVLLHLSQKLLGEPESPIFDLGADRAYGELLIYVKLVWIAILCFTLARRRRAAVLAALGLAALVLLMEDALLLHERLARSLSGSVAEAMPAIAELGIFRHQVVELVWFAAIGVAITVIAAVGYLRASVANRRDALSIATFFGVLAVFAVGVDTIHSFFEIGSIGDLVFTVLEDGGEVFALSPAVALAFALNTEPAARPVQVDAVTQSDGEVQVDAVTQPDAAAQAGAAYPRATTGDDRIRETAAPAEELTR